MNIKAIKKLRDRLSAVPMEFYLDAEGNTTIRYDLWEETAWIKQSGKEMALSEDDLRKLYQVLGKLLA
jgi:hypothetical protein